MLVDDERIVTDALKGQLRRMFGPQFRYETTESVDEAIEVVRELDGQGELVLAVVTDYLMPRQTGDVLMRHLADQFPGVGRILLTGQAPQDVLDGQVDGLAQAVLTKPWSADALATAILDVMSQLDRSTG